VATNADATYCFARVRGLDPGRQPQAFLVLKLRVLVSYHNRGTRPLIVPMERERTVYTALRLGAPMNKLHGLYPLLEPAYAPMKDLPADVSPASPIDPKNDVFTVIPAGGEMTPPLEEELTIPVDRQALFRHDPDLRGRRLYLRLQFAHRQLTPALEADLSDRWTRFGVPWTGTVMTNMFVVDVPKEPKAAPCNDAGPSAH
jgi:hypothetical protein